MKTTLLVLGLLATVSPAPACESPAPRAASAAISRAVERSVELVRQREVEREVGTTIARRLPDGTVVLMPGREFVFSPEADESGDVPRWFEYVTPAGGNRRFSARTETTITVPKGIALELSNLFGDIKVDAWDQNAVRIVALHGQRDRLQARVVALRGKMDAERRRAMAEARRAGRPIPEPEQGALQVDMVSRGGFPAVVDYTITVPQWMALRLSGMESDITVEGVRSAIEAESIRGSVLVRGGRGRVELSSVEGEVKAFDCEGGLEASSINSGVELDDVSGVLMVESVNGDIRIGRATSQNVDASSVNGTVTYAGAFAPQGRYRLATHAGNLVVGVPVGAGVDVSVATFQGGFRSAFPVELGPWRQGQKFNFVLGDGGSSLELESFQGLIELLRPAEVPAIAPVPRVTPATPKAPKPPKPAIKAHKAPHPTPDAPDPEEDK